MSTFRKRRRNAPPGFFAVEAAGLRWLDAAGAVRVARVLDVTDDAIELERLPTAPPTADAAEDFGVRLARLHDAGAPAFGAGPAGWEGDGWIGDAPLPLRTAPTWGAFHARHRIAPYLDAAGLTGPPRATLETLVAALARGIFDDPAPPARIHGDLWNGNVVWTPTGAALIDPAAHGGHRLGDLAMLTLFGLPHLEVVLGAYAQASGSLPDDWRALLCLHRVHPLLVHAVLFGGAYADAAAREASAALALAGAR